jgi:hypothetical protein
MNQQTQSAAAQPIPATTIAAIRDNSEHAALIVNPLADKQDLLHWCVYESDQMEHLANMGREEVFAGDCARTVEQLRARLEVLSAVLHRVQDMDKPTQH